ncbi:MvaI/BcnI family restriction endonuclease [Planctomycetota bacterium]|nr:MvaI/BcnI family restriction endonuclease [Planctomycetota bacterium]
MNTRELSSKEATNLKQIRGAGIDAALLFLTETGLRKSILDAVFPLRSLLKKSKLHDYTVQAQGVDAKVMIGSTLFSRGRVSTLPTSLYRPNTKNGDPRIWFSRLGSLAAPDDVLAVGVHDAGIVCFNLSAIDAGNVANPEGTFLRGIDSTNSAANELLTMLQDLARTGPLEAVCGGSTAIGRTIETRLGIPINSSRNPDYKGIEIKSGRAATATRNETRKTLFACVPDWSVSSCKSSKEILQRHGYESGSGFALRCTISTTRPNSQFLQLELDHLQDWLAEFVARNPREEVAIWPLEKLHDRLLAKHRETFWIKALSEKINGKEHFTLQSVQHTKKPSIVSFDEYLADGTITVDHLIKSTPTGGAAEKGPLFKIAPNRIEGLFLAPAVLHELST